MRTCEVSEGWTAAINFPILPWVLSCHVIHTNHFEFCGLSLSRRFRLGVGRELPPQLLLCRIG